MANRTKVTQQKRARERAKQERQQEKTRRREEAKSRKTPSARSDNGEDPDIAGIIPGPQPSPWGDELLTQRNQRKSSSVPSSFHFSAGSLPSVVRLPSSLRIVVPVNKRGE